MSRPGGAWGAGCGVLGLLGLLLGVGLTVWLGSRAFDASTGKEGWDRVSAAEPMRAYWKRVWRLTDMPYPNPMHLMLRSTDPVDTLSSLLADLHLGKYPLLHGRQFEVTVGQGSMPGCTVELLGSTEAVAMPGGDGHAER